MMDMRRLDRAVDREEAQSYLREATVGYLALAENNIPYAIPLHFVWHKQSIYFHCAPEGRKITILRQNPQCTFAVSFLDGIKSGGSACEYGTYYRSAIVEGVARFVSDAEEKLMALTALTEKHAQVPFSPVTAAGMAKTTVIAIDIVNISGKARRS